MLNPHDDPLHFKELVKSIEDLREKREELNRQILKDGVLGKLSIKSIYKIH